jgi:hypothetical protein
MKLDYDDIFQLLWMQISSLNDKGLLKLKNLHVGKNLISRKL